MDNAISFSTVKKIRVSRIRIIFNSRSFLATLSMFLVIDPKSRLRMKIVLGLSAAKVKFFVISIMILNVNMS